MNVRMTMSVMLRKRARENVGEIEEWPKNAGNEK